MPTVDNKIVQMNFENKQFERGVKESLHSLEELKKALDLDKSAQSLQNLERAAERFDISGISKSVDSIADRFSLLGNIGQEIFHRISNTAVDAMQNVVRTITAMPQAGLSKYESKNKAVQMIQGANPEKSLAEIEAVLARLNEYTDLTSYDFSSMAQNIGKFTAAGVDLDVAERAMEGIANETASAGGEIWQANIAMNNFSQALAAGAMKLNDWKSLEYQNLATDEFKETIIDTAIELGVLQKAGQHTGVLLKRTSKGVQQVEVNATNLRETLNEGWFNNSVMIKVLELYADRESEVGKKGFEMAKVAITLTQSFQAVKDAISTNWMKSWEYIFGDLEEATALFTRISDALIDFTDKIGSFRNRILEGWHTGGEDGISGYTMAIEALSNAWQTLMGIAEAGSRAVTDVFGMIDSSGLIAMTQSLRDFTQGIRDFFGYSEETVTHTKRVWETVEGIPEWTHEIKKGMKGTDVENLQKRLLSLKNDLIRLDKFGADGIFGPETKAALEAFQREYGLAVTGVYDQQTRDALEKAMYPNGKKVRTVKEYEETVTHIGTGLELVQKAFKGVMSLVKAGFGVLKIGLTIVGRVANLFVPIAKGVLTLAAGFGDLISYVVDFFDALLDGETALAGFDAFLAPISATLGVVGGVLESIGDGISKLVAMARGATDFESLGEMLKLDPETNKNAIWLYDAIASIRNVIEKIRPSVERIVGAVSGFFETVRAWVGDKITTALEAIGGFFTDLWSKIAEGDLLQRVLDGVATGLQLILGIIAGVGYGIYSLGKSIVDSAVAVYEFVKNSKLLKTIMSTLSTFFAPVRDFFKAIWDGLTKIRGQIPMFKNFNQFWNAFMAHLAKNPLGSKFIKPLTNIKNTVVKIINKFKEFKSIVTKVFDKIAPVVSEFGTAISDTIANFFGGDGVPIGEKIGGWFSGIKTTVQTNWEKFSKWISGIVDNSPFLSKIREFGSIIGQAFSDFFSMDTSGAATAWEAITMRFCALWETISNWVTEVVDNSPFLSSIREFGSLIVQAFSDFFTIDTSGAASTGEAIMMRLQAFDPVIEWIKEKFGVLKEALTGEGSLISKIKSFFSIDEGSVLGSIISGAKGLAGWVGGFDLDAIWDGIKKAFNVFILVTIIRTLSRFSKSLAVLTGAQSKQSDKGKLILEMAISIGIIAGALALLAHVNALEALKGVGVMTMALVIMVAAMAALNKWADVKSVGIGLLSIAGSIILTIIGLWSAMNLIKNADPGNLVGGIVLVAAIITALTLVARAINKTNTSGGSYGGAATVAAMCLGLIFVVEAVNKLQQSLKENGWATLGSFAIIEAIIATLGYIAVKLSKAGEMKGGIGGAGVVLAIAWAVGRVVNAISNIKKMLTNNVGATLGAFAIVEVLIATLGYVAVKLNEFGRNTSGMGGIIAGAAAIAVIGYVINRMAETMAESISKIADVDPAIVIAFMAGMDIAVLLMGGMIKTFGSIPPASIKGILSGSLGFVAIMTAIGAGIDIAATFVADAMKKMATALWLVGSRLADFSDFMKRVNTRTIHTALDCLVMEVLPAIVDITKNSSAIQSGVEAATNIWLFGVAIGLFSSSISGITADTGSGIKQLATDVQETINTINSIQGVDAAKDVLESLGAAFKIYYTDLATAGVGENGEEGQAEGNFDINKANEAFQNLADLTLDEETIKKIQSYAKGGDNDLNTMAEGIVNLGAALQSYGENVGTLDETAIGNANSVLSMALTIQQALNDVSQIPFTILNGKRQTLSNFGLDIAALGGALKKYGDSIKGLDDTKIELAKTAMTAISEIAGKLPITGGIIRFVAGSKDLSDFASNISALGDGMAQYANKVSEASFDNVEASVAPLEAMGRVQAMLQKNGGIAKLISGSAKIGELGDGLADLGTDLKNFAQGDIKDLEESDFKNIENALAPVTILAEAQSKIQKEGGWTEFLTGSSNISNLGEGLVGFGTKLLIFSTLVSEFDAEEPHLLGALGILERIVGMQTAIQNGDAEYDLTNLGRSFNTMLQMISESISPSSGEGSIAEMATSSTEALMTSIIDSINAFQDEFESAGVNLDKGLAAGLMNGRSTAINAAAFVALSAYARACKVLGIHSPSEEMKWVGEMFVQGFTDAVSGNTNIAEETVDNMFEQALSGADQGLKNFVSIIQNGIDENLKISPILDLSDAGSWGSQIAGMLGQQSIDVGANLAKNVATGSGTTIIQNAAGADNSKVVSAIDDLNTRMDEIAKAIGSMRLVLNTGVLVGQLAGPLDRILGENASRSARR